MRHCEEIGLWPENPGWPKFFHGWRDAETFGRPMFFCRRVDASLFAEFYGYEPTRIEAEENPEAKWIVDRPSEPWGKFRSIANPERWAHKRRPNIGRQELIVAAEIRKLSGKKRREAVKMQRKMILKKPNRKWGRVFKDFLEREPIDA